MKSGSLNKFIFIEKQIEIDDDFGEPMVTWKKITPDKIPAAIYPVRGREKYMSNEKYAHATNEIVVRFMKGITPKHRIVWNDLHEDRERIFDIISTLNLGTRSRQLKIIVKEQV